MGSHDVALDVVVGALAERGFTARTIAVGSQGGVAAASRGECDLAPVHLIDPASGIYNAHLLAPGLSLVQGWQRMQGFVFRPGDARFEGKQRAGGDQGRARRSGLPDGQPQCRRRHARADRPAARRRAAARLRQPAALAQRGRRRGRAGARRLGRRHRAGGAALRPRLPADRAGALRFPAGREPPRAAGGAGVPRGAARSGDARAHRALGMRPADD